jgi:hypothetical protein
LGQWDRYYPSVLWDRLDRWDLFHQ